jgi:hypothetical protein
LPPSALLVVAGAAALVLATTDDDESPAGPPGPTRVTSLPAKTRTASGRPVVVDAKPGDASERSGGGDLCATAAIGDEGESRSCGPKGLLGLLDGAVAYDCGRNEATLFGHVRQDVRDMRSPARAAGATLPLGRGGVKGAFTFALPLDTRHLPADVRLVNGRGRTVKVVPIGEVCPPGATHRSILPIGVPV